MIEDVSVERMHSTVLFDDRVPPLAEICSKVTEICSLPVVVLESTTEELCDWQATIAFACAQDSPLKLSVHQTTVCQLREETSSAPAHNPPIRSIAVDLQGHLGQERTLIVTTELALESLGGAPWEGIPDNDRREFAKPISELELRARRREMERQMRRVALTTILMLPVLVPMGCLWLFVTVPWRLWRCCRSFARRHRDREVLPCI